MNLPNSLTLLRIFFVPVLIVILLTRSPNFEFWGFSMHFEVWGVLILLLAAATDWADGYLARRRLQVTTLGILLDPIADKRDRKSTRLNSSHGYISYAVFCLKKKKESPRSCAKFSQVSSPWRRGGSLSL